MSRVLRLDRSMKRRWPLHPRRYAAGLLAVLSFSQSAPLYGENDRPVITIGPQKHLFLDDALIASKKNVRRRVHAARKHEGNPVIRRTEPWENPFLILYGSVIRDEGRYKAWFKSGDGVGYAESDDGITWIKPQLDLVLIDGRRTNLLFRQRGEKSGPEELPYYHEIFGVSRDNREPDPSRRYKMGFLSIDFDHTGPRESPFLKGQRRGLGVAGSPDGIHWKRIDHWASEAICDGATHWMFDPALGRYVLFGRTLKALPEVQSAWSGFYWYRRWHSGRAVARMESSDFVKWSHVDPDTAPVVMTADLQDPPGTEIYSMMVFPYESVYIGLVQVFHARPDTCFLDVQLAVSRDGVRFERVEGRQTFLEAGGVGEWDRFNQSPANNPPVVVGDELRFYYGGRTYRHAPYEGKDTGPRAGGIGLATIPRDRFVSLEASFDGGEIVTHPLRLGGGRLHLNARSDFGEIVVEALPATTPTSDAARPPARSRPITADSLDAIVDWEGPAPDPQGPPVVLRIRLSNACLYALWCH